MDLLNFAQTRKQRRVDPQEAKATLDYAARPYQPMADPVVRQELDFSKAQHDENMRQKMIFEGRMEQAMQQEKLYDQMGQEAEARLLERYPEAAEIITQYKQALPEAIKMGLMEGAMGSERSQQSGRSGGWLS